MSFIADAANMLLETIKNDVFRDFLLLVGLFYVSKFVLKSVCGLYIVFKTFLLPLIWPRNFPEEYGSWAGNPSP